MPLDVGNGRAVVVRQVAHSSGAAGAEYVTAVRESKVQGNGVRVGPCPAAPLESAVRSR